MRREASFFFSGFFFGWSGKQCPRHAATCRTACALFLFNAVTCDLPVLRKKKADKSDTLEDEPSSSLQQLHRAEG